LHFSNKKLKIGEHCPINIETNSREKEIEEYEWIKDVPHDLPTQAFGGISLKNEFESKLSSNFLKDFLQMPTKDNAEAFLTLIKKKWKL
jgi:hypothetical protein